MSLWIFRNGIPLNVVRVDVVSWCLFTTRRIGGEASSKDSRRSLFTGTMGVGQTIRSGRDSKSMAQGMCVGG